MSAVFGRHSLLFGLLGCALFAAAPAQADTVSVSLDQARLLKIPDRVTTIVIGNPLIADAALQGGGLLVVTGKGYGATNLLALDRDGKVVMSRAAGSGPRRRRFGGGLSRRRARNLELRAGMPAAHHARGRHGLLRGYDRPGRRAQRRGARRWRRRRAGRATGGALRLTDRRKHG